VKPRRFLPLILTVLLVLVFAVLLYGQLQPAGEAERPLQIVFFDVGQGDAAFIRTPEGRTALIDGGRNRGSVSDYLEALGVERLDLVVASHADLDHIGGLIEAVRRFEIGFFMDNGIPHTTQAYGDLLLAVEESSATYLEAEERTLTLGSAELFILPPPRLNRDQNDNSVGVILDYDGFRAVFSGDATHRTQRWWLERYEPELSNVDVYKAAHHGSQTGDGLAFMEVLRPEVVVIGVGEANPYGHPSPEALVNYSAVDAEVYRTDLHGHVTVSAAGLGRWEVATGPLPEWGFLEPMGRLERLLWELLR
jgi:competence protein ComEC